MYSRRRRYLHSLAQQQTPPAAPLRNGEQTTVYIVPATGTGVVNPKWSGMFF